MTVQFLLFLMVILLILIFWELSKINTRLKKALANRESANNETVGSPQTQTAHH